jgi:two-component system, chemotaxis family, protein-glutamate methylesterase/glutaminase
VATDADAVVVIGASAGGIAALPQLVRHLPPDLPAAVLVVQHLYAEFTSSLPEILARAGMLPARHPVNGETIERGVIYVAPPDYHLLLHPPGSIELSHDARVNLHRPAIDLLFRTAARLYGPRTLGVLLTGTKDDGTAGILAIKMRGGVAIVQDPEDAAYGEMPQHALEQVDDIDYVAPLAEIPGLIVQTLEQFVNVPAHGQEEIMVNRAEPSALICPECGGALQPHEEGRLLQYQCHVGHVYGLESLRAAYAQTIEDTMWAALRAFKEQNMLLRQMSAHTSNARLQEEYRKQIEAGEQHERKVRTILQHLGIPSVPGRA